MISEGEREDKARRAPGRATSERTRPGSPPGTTSTLAACTELPDQPHQPPGLNGTRLHTASIWTPGPRAGLVVGHGSSKPFHRAGRPAALEKRRDPTVASDLPRRLPRQRNLFLNTFVSIKSCPSRLILGSVRERVLSISPTIGGGRKSPLSLHPLGLTTLTLPLLCSPFQVLGGALGVHRARAASRWRRPRETRPPMAPPTPSSLRPSQRARPWCQPHTRPGARHPGSSPSWRPARPASSPCAPPALWPALPPPACPPHAPAHAPPPLTRATSSSSLRPSVPPARPCARPEAPERCWGPSTCQR